VTTGAIVTAVEHASVVFTVELPAVNVGVARCAVVGSSPEAAGAILVLAVAFVARDRAVGAAQRECSRCVRLAIEGRGGESKRGMAAPAVRRHRCDVELACVWILVTLSASLGSAIRESPRVLE
jgi:hypothetical protein